MSTRKIDFILLVFIEIFLQVKGKYVKTLPLIHEEGNLTTTIEALRVSSVAISIFSQSESFHHAPTAVVGVQFVPSVYCLRNQTIMRSGLVRAVCRKTAGGRWVSLCALLISRKTIKKQPAPQQHF